MLHKRGFTLIELLVVIAIITILAATVAPRVSNWISRGRMARAASEIRNADLALVKMLADADRKSFAQFFAEPSALKAGGFVFEMDKAANVYELYSNMFYELLRRGKDADLGDIPGGGLDPAVKKKLGTSYMELGTDPWGNPYQFYAGPTSPKALVGFRCYRGAGLTTDPYVYNAEKGNEKIRGNPNPDTDPRSQALVPFRGYPAARDLPVYIWSFGEDRENGQYRYVESILNTVNTADDIYNGGGDDINNWDSGSGWSDLY